VPSLLSTTITCASLPGAPYGTSTIPPITPKELLTTPDRGLAVEYCPDTWHKPIVRKSKNDKTERYILDEIGVLFVRCCMMESSWFALNS